MFLYRVLLTSLAFCLVLPISAQLSDGNPSDATSMTKSSATQPITTQSIPDAVNALQGCQKQCLENALVSIGCGSTNLTCGCVVMDIVKLAQNLTECALPVILGGQGCYDIAVAIKLATHVCSGQLIAAVAEHVLSSVNPQPQATDSPAVHHLARPGGVGNSTPEIDEPDSVVYSPFSFNSSSVGASGVTTAIVWAGTVAVAALLAL